MSDRLELVTDFDSLRAGMRVADLACECCGRAMCPATLARDGMGPIDGQLPRSSLLRPPLATLPAPRRPVDAALRVVRLLEGQAGG